MDTDSQERSKQLQVGARCRGGYAGMLGTLSCPVQGDRKTKPTRTRADRVILADSQRRSLWGGSNRVLTPGASSNDGDKCHTGQAHDC